MYTVRKSVIDSLLLHGWDYPKVQESLSNLSAPVVAALDKPAADYTPRFIGFVVGCILLDTQ